MILAICADPIWRANYRRLVRNREKLTGEPGVAEPEYRLPPTSKSIANIVCAEQTNAITSNRHSIRLGRPIYLWLHNILFRTLDRSDNLLQLDWLWHHLVLRRRLHVPCRKLSFVRCICTCCELVCEEYFWCCISVSLKVNYADTHKC